MSSTSSTATTSSSLSTTALVLGIAAALVAAFGGLPLAVIAPGDPVLIGVFTALSYLLPVAGIVAGHLARRREGGRTRAAVGLALSYLALAVALVPLVAGLISLAAQR